MKWILTMGALFVVFLVGGFVAARWMGGFQNAEGMGSGLSSFVFPKPEQRDPVAIYSHGWFEKDFYEEAYGVAGRGGSVTLPTNPTSALVAHHLLIPDKIANVFLQVGSDEVETVVLVSPNHFSVGIHPAQVSEGGWTTPYGQLDPDWDAIEKLLKNAGDLHHEEQAFKGEHGIAALTPFVKRSFPNAKFVPIILDDSLSPYTAAELGKSIAALLPDAVVIASVDMSHNLPEYVAAFHDQITKHALAVGDCPIDSCDLEVDSDPTLRLLFAVNEARGTQSWHQTTHSSSLALGATKDPRENTSHILGYFTEGEGQTDEPYATMHFLGDIMLDRGVRKAMDAAGTVEYPWENMHRFLQGTDLVVANLEGTVNEQKSTYTYDPPFRFVFDPAAVEELTKYVDVVSLANNHASDVGSAGERETHTWLDGMKLPWFGSYLSPVPRYDQEVGGVPITIIGYHAFQPNEDLLFGEIQHAKSQGRFVIVYPHWGAEYIFSPDSSERRLAQVMVDAGADLVIGGHPHVPQGVGVIDGVPIVYSLGNFIFDQQIPKTWQALTAGVIVTPSTIQISLLPISARDGQPGPLTDAEASALLEKLAGVSDASLADAVRKGTLIFSR